MLRKRNNLWLAVLAAVIVVAAVWGPESLAAYSDRNFMNHIETDRLREESEGYRYTLSSNEKLYILARCLNSQKLPQSELSSMTKVESQEAEYEEFAGTYAFVVNRQGPSEQEITNQEIFDICNQQLAELKNLGILPDTVREVTADSYSAVLYSAIDVLEPRNNLSVWKVSLSTSQQNADKSNRLLDVYLDGETGKIYEFYVRIQQNWEELDPAGIMESWSGYMSLENGARQENENPLAENTPYFQQYLFPGMEEQNTVVTIGFYEGINELFLKVTK